MNNPYAQQQRTALEHATPQAAEGYALIEMARRLDEARRNPDNTANIQDQTRVNWRIWTIIQSELVDPDCTVPKEIRENLLNLSNFVDKRSAELLADPDPDKLQVLININRQIGAGLMGNPGEGANPQPPASDGQASQESNEAGDALSSVTSNSDREV